MNPSLRITRGVPSCILAIDRVEANMEGTWSLTIQREERGRNISRTADVELVMVELPDSVILQYGDETFRDTDRSPSLGRGSFNHHLPFNGPNYTSINGLFDPQTPTTPYPYWTNLSVSLLALWTL